MIVLGIDPGKSGALAFYDPGRDELEVLDIPTIQAGPKGRTAVDEEGVAAIIRSRADFVSHAWLEQVGVMPGEGAVGAFSFGTTFGLLRMALVAHFIPRTLVTPVKWKRALSVPAAKDGAVARACQLLPRHAGLFRGPRGGLMDGRAEAALIAYYGAKHAA